MLKWCLGSHKCFGWTEGECEGYGFEDGGVVVEVRSGVWIWRGIS